MEVDVALSIDKEMYYNSQKKITLQNIVPDDDSSMRVLLKYSCNHPKGKLKLEILEPDWLAGLSHRTKVVAKHIFALAAAPKSKFGFTKVDTICLKQIRIYTED